jgi:hypothetical protein
MPDELPEEHPEPETQPQFARLPPGGPPATAAGLADRPEAGPWGLLEALPVVLFLLLLTSLSLGTSERNVSHIHIRTVLISQALLYLLILLYVHFVVKLRRRLPFWAALGWRWLAPGRFLLAGLGLALFVQLLRLPSAKKLPIERLFENANAAYLLAAFGILVAPLVEEILFRGFIFVAVERSWGVAHAVWITAMLFGLVHVPQLVGGIPQMVAILGVGVVLSWVRAATRSLAASYFIHLGYNTTLFGMLFIATHGFRQWS